MFLSNNVLGFRIGSEASASSAVGIAVYEAFPERVHGLFCFVFCFFF